MFADSSNKDMQENARSGIQQLPLLPFAIQLQNIFPVEMVAKRFPVEVGNMDMIEPIGVQTELNLNDSSIDTKALRAQIYLDVRVSFSQEPRLFEIYFRLVGMFSYEKQCQPDMILNFLQQGSLSVMLPSARELLLSLCIRLQVPMIVLPLVQLARPTTSSESSDVSHKSE